MIEVKNLKKIYKNPNGEKVYACNDISFVLPNKGLVFITGESGSGKTTLLNVLGGLDKKTSGAYYVDGVNVDDYKSLDEFRNDCVGFVFQDYNLIESMTVYKNLELILSLQNDKHKMKIYDALDKVGLGGFEHKKVSQLSGGQKQRVAVARALIKNSAFILADEPTGNLDSNNSKEIFKLLKEISADKLVIVVSHDQASCKKYGDRIITLRDGKIIDDVQLKKKLDYSLTQTPIQCEKNKHKLPLSYVLSMSMSNIRQHIWKFIVSVILFALTIFSISLSLKFVTYNAEDSIASTFKNDYSSLYLANSTESAGEKSAMYFLSDIRLDDRFTNDNIALNHKHIFGYNMMLNKEEIAMYIDRSFYLISQKQDLFDMGKSLYGDCVIDDNGVIVTDYVFDYLLYSDDAISLDVDFSDKDYSKLKGAKLRKYDVWDNKYDTLFTINGVIKTDYKQYCSADFKLLNNLKSPYVGEMENTEYARRQVAIEYIPYYCTIGYIQNIDRYHVGLSKTKLDYIEVKANNNSIDLNYIDIVDAKKVSRDVYDANGNIVNSENVTLKDDEVLLNLELYNRLFKNEVKYIDLVRSANSERNAYTYTFAHMNEKIDFRYYAEGNVDLLWLQGKKIVGVVVKEYFMQLDDYAEIYVPSNVVKQNAILDYNRNLVKINFTSSVDMKNSITHLRKQYNIGVYSVVANSLYDFEHVSTTLFNVFIILGGVFVVISLLVSINIITFSIRARIKEIGILRALGTRSIDLEKIFVIESLLIGLFSFIISNILLFVAMQIINGILGSTLYGGVQYLVLHAFVPIVSFVLAIISSLLASIVPIKRINSISPMTAIRTS